MEDSVKFAQPSVTSGTKSINAANAMKESVETTPSFTNGISSAKPLVNTLPEGLDGELVQKLYSASTEAKLWAIASKTLTQASPPRFYPEYTEPGGTEYVYRELDFWTSGFFPGSLYVLLERRKKFPHLFAMSSESPHDLQIQFACNWWTENLHQNALLQATHDLGFMIMPWARHAWELNGDARALGSLKAAAKTLADRFNPSVGCIRSWDICKTKKYDFQDPSNEFLVVIDNMMNLSMLFYVSQHTGDQAMRDVAIQHARTSTRFHVRSDSSTTHLVVFDPATGDVKARLTNQGYSHTSCWTRGQAWAIAGFAETFHWTQEQEFLDTARSCADHFLQRLPGSGIAPWDFDAHEQLGAREEQPPDTSATMIAAYGLLLIHRGVLARGEKSRYLAAALRLARAVSASRLNAPASYVSKPWDINTVEHGMWRGCPRLEVDVGVGETILGGATINNYEYAPRRWADHGLVYADYYFLLFGNELLKMNLGSVIGEQL